MAATVTATAIPAADFDPYTQPVIFHFADGTSFAVSIIEINDFVQYNTKIGINYGAQLGASLITLLIVGMLTAPEKRRTPVFALNAVALFCSVTRMICMSAYFTTQFSEVYTYFSGDYSSVPTSAYANSILGVVLTTILLICVEFSLLIQAHALCATLPSFYRRIIVGFSLIVVLLTIGFRLGMTVENCKAIVKASDSSPYVWVQSTTNIVIIVSVCYFSAVFLSKLGYAIYARKKLGMQGFGAMQVIFIMSCQTMIIPAALSLMEYWVRVPEINQNAYTLMAISLPLTSIWASTAVKNSHQALQGGPESQRRKLWAGMLGTSGNYTSTPNQKERSDSGNSQFRGLNSDPDTLITSRSMSAEQFDRMYPDLEQCSGNAR